MAERELRRLYSPAAGVVRSLNELNSGEFKQGGEGFAVCAEGFIMRTYYRLVPAVEVCSPVDGALIAASPREFRLRTGDGLEISVKLPGDAEYFLQTGYMAPAGEPVCRISREDFSRESACILVDFCDVGRITELHVFSGVKRSGSQAAEYFPRDPLLK